MPITSTQSFQGTSVSGRGDHSLRPLVSAISARLRARCRVAGGTRRGGGPQLHLAVGAGLCPYGKNIRTVSGVCCQAPATFGAFFFCLQLLLFAGKRGPPVVRHFDGGES